MYRQQGNQKFPENCEINISPYTATSYERIQQNTLKKVIEFLEFLLPDLPPKNPVAQRFCSRGISMDNGLLTTPEFYLVLVILFVFCSFSG
jgi:hypothetical protein